MKKYLTVNAAKTDTEENEILVHGPIGSSSWDENGISGKDFTDALNKFPKGRKITIGVNSQGGSVGEGLAIFNAIQRRSEDATVRIDGYAISIASVFPLAASKVISPKSSIWMIHNAWAWAAGNADEMRKQADVLDTHDKTLVGIYAAKTGKSEKEIQEAMAEETWFSGDEAVEWGLADEIEDKDVSDALNKIDFSKAPQGTFKNVPANFMAMASFKNLPAAMGGAGAKTKPNENRPSPPTGGTTNPNIMEKTKIVALLKAQGIEASIDETVEALEAKLTQALAKKPETKQEPAAKDDDSDVKAELKRIKAQLETERVNRVTRAIDQLVIENRLTVEDGKEWLPQCIANETILASLKKLPQNFPGTDPLNAHTESFGNPTIEAYNKLKPGAARKAFLIENHSQLRSQMVRHMPQNANTIDSALVTSHLADGLVVVAPNKLAMVSSFSREFSIDLVKPLATVQVKKAISGATGQEDPTDFEATPDSNLDNIAVTMHQQSLTFNLSNNDMLNGVRLADLSEINADTYCNHLADKIAAVLSVANFGAAVTVGSAANFDPDSLSPILAVAKNYRRKNLILDGGHLAYITPKLTTNLDWRTGGAFGFDSISEHNRWTNAATNAVGFVCSPDAVGIATGMAGELPAGEFLSITNVVLHQAITVRVAAWYSRQYRQWFTCFDIMLGIAAGDTPQGEVLVTS